MFVLHAHCDTDVMFVFFSVSTALQDTWVWNGRPAWNDIFEQMKVQAMDPDVGVFFCGAAVIGADLQKMCNEHSVPNGVTFSLHKENF